MPLAFIKSINLMTRFVLLAGVVLLVGMLGIGIWVGGQVERIVTNNAAATTALYVDSMVSPLVQTLSHNSRLSQAEAERLASLLDQTALSREVSAFKIWNTDGRVIFSDRPERIGYLAPENLRLRVALSGVVNAEIRNVTDPALSSTRELMEVYSPVRSNLTGDVIAVAEFYTSTDALHEDLHASRLRGWFVFGAVTLAMFLTLYVMFAQGHRTIQSQRQEMNRQINELSNLLRRNTALRKRLAQANYRIADLNEQTLRRVSADLHDGPAQLMAFAAMRLDGVQGQEQVAQAVNEALADLRLICRGMVLPELHNWSVATIAERVVGIYESRMNTRISLSIDGSLPDLGIAKKNCIYRFLQETLNNSARHAAGTRQSVVIRALPDMIEVEVSDTGPGFDPAHPTTGLGLAGLRDRITALDGVFELKTATGRGTCVKMRLPLDEIEA